MISFTNTVHINRSTADVYAYLSDLEHIPEWNWAITDTKKMTPGPVAVGTRYVQTRSVPKPASETLEIVGLDPNLRIEINGVLAELPAHVTYHLAEKGNGTELTNTIELEPKGALRLIAPAVGGRIKRAVADNLNALKALLGG